ncbi:MAG TPA: RnfABCDGE type electron transport complex subunit D, partial [Acidobacteriota bacterium]|nr:RnfABCDGE type electron transport complex subunit D [Acidobacteriota bacterium]
MKQRPRELVISTSPFLKTETSTPRIMAEVNLALLPVLAAAGYYFGLGALLVVAASALGAVGTEYLFTRPKATLRDNSALLTGVLLGLVLPPAFPLWMAFLGGCVAIGLGKLIWGGLGQNIFNPALVGRAFLQACFPTAITTWTPPGGGFFHLSPRLFAVPLMQAPLDTVSGATPLGLAKFENQSTAWMPLLSGDIGGSIGETSAAVLILCGLWLAVRRVFD